jgi:hypothetical protein
VSDDVAESRRSGPGTVWDNYVVAQTVQASLGLIPPHTLALGAAVDRFDVELVFQLSEAAEQDRRDIEEIRENFRRSWVTPSTSRPCCVGRATCRRSAGSGGSTLPARATTTTAAVACTHTRIVEHLEIVDLGHSCGLLGFRALRVMSRRRV